MSEVHFFIFYGLVTLPSTVAFGFVIAAVLSAFVETLKAHRIALILTIVSVLGLVIVFATVSVTLALVALLSGGVGLFILQRMLSKRESSRG